MFNPFLVRKNDEGKTSAQGALKDGPCVIPMGHGE